MIERTSAKSLQIELVIKYDTNDAYKESVVGGVQIYEEGSISASGFGPGGPNPLRHQPPSLSKKWCTWKNVSYVCKRLRINSSHIVATGS